jgi:hypothetical protein
MAQQQQQSAANRSSQRETSRSRLAPSNQSPSTSRSSSPSSPAQSQAPSIGQIFAGISRMLTWLYYLAFIAIAAWLLWKNWEQVVRAFRELLTSLQNLLSSLLGWNGRRQQPLVATDSAPAKPRVPSFASFTNPFATGDAQQTSLKELVTYTFRALEAWSQDRGRPRGDEQTPLEFAHMVASAEPDLGADAKDVCELYCRLAYGNGQLPRQSRDVLERFWQELESVGRA